MTGHGGIKHFKGPENQFSDTTSGGAFTRFTCGHCGREAVAAVIAEATTQGTQSVRWVRCSGCHAGSVYSTDSQFPAPLPGEGLDGLPEDIKSAHQEARSCAGVEAYTSCEMMCRKILMHVAVDKGAQEGKTFATYIEYLETGGYTTPPMKPWVDIIRKNGNVAVHEIPATNKDRALSTLIFTEQLLRTVYVMEHLAQKFAP
ncbi:MULTISPECIES: DUF4145 domain-containing protein [unclassified Kitasatospora]|uniref:DUF4145 domain-containing protein n=1 Tax=unclassified Kitasatospora TaxID=2633591 RepID=UPI0009E8969F|nr:MULTISPECIES: DUF4145 domain-containing protein [unclassified Kitasatospora]